ncbi:anti-sigma factor antagonist [Streptomyces sp. NPDC006602]|uniref:anti-sigma factor antagonist n=1 Tax=Streptomyces sp. NPDC006602 TaxID=3364751 RepID=UPI003699F4AC
MTIEWRYTVDQELGILSVAGHLGPDAVHRFSGAVGWVVARGAAMIPPGLLPPTARTAGAHRLRCPARHPDRWGGTAREPAGGALVPGRVSAARRCASPKRPSRNVLSC